MARREINRKLNTRLFTFARDWQQCIWPARSSGTLRSSREQSSRASHPWTRTSSGSSECAEKYTFYFLWSGQYCKRRHQGRHNLGHIPALRFPRLIPAGKVYDYSLSRVLSPRAGRCIEALINSYGGQKPRVIVTASHSSSCSIYVNINNFNREWMDE